MQSQVGDEERLNGHNSSGIRMFVIIPTLMLGLNSGSLTMPPPTADGAPNMQAMPVLEMGWLKHPADRVRLRDALRLALKLAAAKEMASVIEEPYASTVLASCRTRRSARTAGCRGRPRTETTR